MMLKYFAFTNQWIAELISGNGLKRAGPLTQRSADRNLVLTNSVRISLVPSGAVFYHPRLESGTPAPLSNQVVYSLELTILSILLK
jgi:hypothetical protein